MVKKYYAIKQGRKTGIFSGQWKQIEKKYIKGFPNPEFKGFNDKSEAEKYLTKSKSKSERKGGNNSERKERGVEARRKGEERKDLREQIIYSENTIEITEKSKVSIILIGHQYVHLINKPGGSEYILLHEESGKYLKVISEDKDNTSQNRAIIEGLIESISKLKSPCHIKFYTKTYVGIKKMIKNSKSPNADYLEVLKNLLLNNNHVIEEIVDIDIVADFFKQYK